jgi:hypothetical protein
MTMVLLNDLVEQRGEGCVRFVGSSIHTDARVDVLAPGEDGILEGEPMGIRLASKLVPNLRGKELAQERASTCREYR